MAFGKLDIDILGTSFSIQANESNEYLDEVYKYYVNCVQQVKKTVGSELEPIKLAIIAGILLSDELKKERGILKRLTPDEQENYQIVNRTKVLIQKLDDILSDENLG